MSVLVQHTQPLANRLVYLAYPHKPYKLVTFRDGPSPDTVYIAHQALDALGANVEILDTLDCQRRLLAQHIPSMVLEISGFGTRPFSESLLGNICAATGVSYFPSNGFAQIVASDKLISKHFANQAGLLTPRTVVSPQGVTDGTRLLKANLRGRKPRSSRS